MTTLKKEAEALGIEIDGRWSDETLKQKIDEAKAQRSGQKSSEASAPEADTRDIENKADQGEKEELYPIRLLVDWWDGQGIRRARNSEVEVPWNEAKKLVGEGKAERDDAWTTKRR